MTDLFQYPSELYKKKMFEIKKNPIYYTLEMNSALQMRSRLTILYGEMLHQLLRVLSLEGGRFLE